MRSCALQHYVHLYAQEPCCLMIALYTLDTYFMYVNHEQQTPAASSLECIGSEECQCGLATVPTCHIALRHVVMWQTLSLLKLHSTHEPPPNRPYKSGESTCQQISNTFEACCDGSKSEGKRVAECLICFGGPCTMSASSDSVYGTTSRWEES